MNQHFSILLLVIILSICITVNTEDVSSVLLFGTKTQSTKVVELIEYNPKTNEYQNLTTLNWSQTTQSPISGGGVYYKTRVFYGYYYAPNKGDYINNILQIDTNTGEYSNIENFAENFVVGVAIDQSTGDIHFLNFTLAVKSGNTFTNKGDWWSYNVNSQSYTLIRKDVATNSILGLSVYSMVYSIDSQSLWVLCDNNLYGFNRNEENQIIPVTSKKPFLFLNQMTINPKTSEIYLIPYSVHTGSSNSELNTTIYRVDFGSQLNEATFVPVCDGHFEGNLNFIWVNPFQSDIDYVSNTLITLLRITTDRPKNGIYTVNLDTCEFTQTNITSTYLMNFPRFLPPI